MSIQRSLIFLSLILTVRSDNHIPMRAGAPFKIALFADLHFGEDAWTEWGPQQDLDSVRVMSSVLDTEHPDFLIYLGDVITANNVMLKNATSYWDRALSPARERGIPWSTVFGNHDDASFEWPVEWFSEIAVPPLRCPNPNASINSACEIGGTTRLELTKAEIELNALSYTKHGPLNLWPSVSNYVIKLYSSSRNPMVYMYFFDSGGGSYPEIISNAQLKWFEQKSEEVNPDSSVAEIVFWHVPSEAYRDVAPKFDSRGHCVGSIFSEEVASQKAEMGIMEVIEKRASVKAVFVGHNHGLDWCCPRNENLWLCFARRTGYGGYGDWARGARIVEVNEEPFSIKSWIRMEDGHLHSEVVLMS